MRCPADRPRPHGNRRGLASGQRGLASLELVLCLPIIMVLAVLALTVVQLGHKKLNTQAAARTGAYVQAFDLPPREQRTEGQSDAGTSFVTTMGMTDPRFEGLNATPTKPTTVIVDSDYLARRSLGGWTLTVSTQHAVVAAPIWEREQIPLGYDRYLRSRLKDAEYDLGIFSGNASDALPEVFPRAK